jgi:hypothetical protein
VPIDNTVKTRLILIIRLASGAMITVPLVLINTFTHATHVLGKISIMTTFG